MACRWPSNWRRPGCGCCRRREIAARLGDRFRLLAGGMRTAVARHRTLRAVVEWSWELLTDEERLLAERLAVFAAGATIDAATAVCADGRLDAFDIRDLLERVGGQVLAGDGCADAGTPAAACDTGCWRRSGSTASNGWTNETNSSMPVRRTLPYYADVAAKLSPVLRTAEQLVALAEFAQERDNLLAALRFLGDSGDGARALRMVLDLGWYWNITGSHTEMLTWTEFALAASEGMDTPDRTKVEAGRVLAVMSNAQAQDEAWESIMQRMAEAADKLAELDDRTDPTIWVVRMISAFFGDRADGVDALIEVGRSSPDPWIRAITAATHVMLLENLGDLDGMRTEIDTAYAGLSRDRRSMGTVEHPHRQGERPVGGRRHRRGDGRLPARACLSRRTRRDRGRSADTTATFGTRLAAQGLYRGAPIRGSRPRRGCQRPAGLERTMLADVSLIMIGLVEGDTGCRDGPRRRSAAPGRGAPRRQHDVRPHDRARRRRLRLRRGRRRRPGPVPGGPRPRIPRWARVQ